MKTTVEIQDSLLESAKKQAAKEGTTVRALVEEGLRKVLADRQSASAAFVFQPVTFAGEGLQADLDGASWDIIRDRIYEGHGA